MILAIETSCDETAVALYSPATAALHADLVSSQIKLHLPYGGVVPELAAREHLQALPLLVGEALHTAGAKLTEVSAVAVTRGPGLKGCLLVGISFAKGLALARNLPLLGINHLEGHLFVGDLGQNGELSLTFPTLALLVSGGHTLLVLVRGVRDYEVVASTRDDAAGEAFDKIATLLGLPYPGGPALAARAAHGNAARVSLPVALPNDLSSFSFSGLKTAVRRLVDAPTFKRDEQSIADLAAAAQEAIVRALTEKTIAAANRLRPQSLLLTGGVAANARLQESLKAFAARAGIPLHLPPKRWCTDNAAMIAAAAARLWAARPQYSDGLEFDALPRWPLQDLAAAVEAADRRQPGEE